MGYVMVDSCVLDSYQSVFFLFVCLFDVIAHNIIHCAYVLTILPI